MIPPDDDSRFIPTSVRAAVAIRNATEDPEASEHHIEQMVGAEPMVAAALLRAANSAAFRRAEGVGGVGQAVMCLGLAHVRSIASHVAMMQLVHGIKPLAARAAAEALLRHSIAVAAFAGHLARQRGHTDPARVASLGLFHEIPLFLFIARAHRRPQDFASPAAMRALLAGAQLRSHEAAMQDLGLPQFAVMTLAECGMLDAAHAYAGEANPLWPHPQDGGDRSEIAASEVAAIEEQARALYALLFEGAGDYDEGAVERHLGISAAAATAPAPSGPQRDEAPRGLLERLQRMVASFLR